MNKLLHPKHHAPGYINVKTQHINIENVNMESTLTCVSKIDNHRFLNPVMRYKFKTIAESLLNHYRDLCCHYQVGL